MKELPEDHVDPQQDGKIHAGERDRADLDSLDATDGDSVSKKIVVWLEEPSGIHESPFRRKRRSVDDQGRGARYRPVMRPPVPILQVLDDGSDGDGEAIRLRTSLFVIGRRTGDLVLPHDRAVSAVHAEILRKRIRQRYVWYLRDRGTRNGTFVRSVRVVLGDHIILLGSRRFRFMNPVGDLSDEGEEVGEQTSLYRRSSPDGGYWPMLCEISSTNQALQIPIPSDNAVIGRAGGGADIQLDDPLLDQKHAMLQRSAAGLWTLTSYPSTNGVWVAVKSIPLTTHCHFQCGEQRFSFTIP